MTITEFLRENVSIFEGIDPDVAHSMARRVEQRRFQKGQTVFFRGSTVEGLHLVATGKVSVHAKPEKGGSPVKLAELGPGEVFGEMSILSEGTANASIRCDEDGTTIFILPQDAFKALLHFNPDMAQRTQELVKRRWAERLAPAAPRPA